MSKDRFIFWNKGGLGWSIGKKAYLTSGSHWHRSGLDSPEPWQGTWEEGVVVDCQSSVSPCSWSDYSPWSPCSATCGEGLQARTRNLLQPNSQCAEQAEQFRPVFSSPCRDQELPHYEWRYYALYFSHLSLSLPVISGRRVEDCSTGDVSSPPAPPPPASPPASSACGPPGVTGAAAR